ncbi:FACT complex subunit SSRP1 [Strongyloides ratti]|uniref:FACT complex subunit SSRP1 n=1 Tax=Strongyloides ratti TaxID=34506 RepID=A0A090KZW9_STRRB|nr:FACT complex subunit SSRP1 [Strongyloides ratti]CEF63075.1 FACT complex subunit SSRP1 [Strongyloides ratti]
MSSARGIIDLTFFIYQIFHTVKAVWRTTLEFIFTKKLLLNYYEMARPSKSVNNENSRGVTKRAKKDANAPKRGKSAYMFWLAENRARLTKPGMGVTDVAKAAGAEWNKLQDKQKWEKMAAEDKERYEKEMATYKANQ